MKTILKLFIKKRILIEEVILSSTLQFENISFINGTNTWTFLKKSV